MNRETGPHDRPALSRQSWRVFLLVVLLVFATRLPFIGFGYGYDDDAWRVMNAARTLSQSGEYHPTRYTGFPIMEFLYSLLWGKPPTIVVLLTVLVTSLGLGILGVTLVRLDLPNVVPLCLAIACTPVIYIASTTSMDYLWALMFMLFAFDRALRGQSLLAGILVGIATGCRFTSFLMVLPLGILLLQTYKGRNRFASLLGLFLTASAATVLLYLPRIVSHAPTAAPAIYPQPIGGWNAVFKGSVGVWGVVGAVAIVAAVLFSTVSFLRERRVQVSQGPFTRRVLAASVVVVILHVLLFSRYPFEAAYLIPAVPFVMVALLMIMRRHLFLVLCVSMIASAFFFGMTRLGNPEGFRASSMRVIFTLAHEELLLDILQGPVLLDLQRRQRTQELVDRLWQYADTTAQRTVVVVGWFLPQLEFEGGGSTARGSAVFVEWLPEHEVERYRGQGYTIRFLPRMDAYHLRSYGVDLVSSGAEELNLYSDELSLH